MKYIYNMLMLLAHINLYYTQLLMKVLMLIPTAIWFPEIHSQVLGHLAWESQRLGNGTAARAGVIIRGKEA